MANKVFSKEEVKWLIDFIPGHTTEETTAAFIEKFNHDVLPTQIVSFRKNRKIPCGISYRFKPGQTSWNKGRKMTDEEKAKSKETWFKKGGRPINTHSVGTILKNKDYWRIKIAEPNKWEAYARYVYKQHYGCTLSKDILIIHLDSNEDNNHIDNLAAVTKSELCRLNYEHLISTDPDITRAGIALVRLNMEITEKSKMHCKYCKWYEASGKKNHFYCNNPKYVRDKEFSMANRCNGYEVGN